MFCLICFGLGIVSILVFLFVPSVVRKQLHYLLNASQVTVANMVRVDLWQNITKHSNTQIADIAGLSMTISTPSDFKSQIPCQKWCWNDIFTNKVKYWTKNVAIILVLLHKQARGKHHPYPTKNPDHMYLSNKIIIVHELCHSSQYHVANYTSFIHGSNGDSNMGIAQVSSLGTVKYRQVKIYTRICDTYVLEMKG